MSLTAHARSPRRRASDAGQSTVEFALMIPVIMTFFFWVFQVNIFMLGYHQMAYASFAAARAHTVERNGSQPEQEVMDAILTGKIFQENVSGPPRIGHSRRQDSRWSVDDGVRITHSGFESLPYVRGLFSIRSEIPTHLGPSEFEASIFPGHGGRADGGTQKRLTDNNTDDFD